VKALRFGLVRYLNTSPFRCGLGEVESASWVEEVPSRLLPLLEEGAVDAAVLPSLDLLTHPTLATLPGGCIASHGAAYSVRLFSRIPLRSVQAVALDISSRTSSALARILLEERDIHATFVDRPPDLGAMLADADAALLIGDPCMQIDASDLLVTDLGEEWLRLTGLPFVFALWAAQPGADHAALNALISDAKKTGLTQVERIATEEAERLGLDRELCLTYLRDHMHYDLNAPERVGLERFRRLAVKHGLIPNAGAIRLALEESP
jgi:chorismate dehydratase